ncbi:MAG TPA: hypothetical protein VJU18_14820 [Vicinamibacteria bacterium]|nr:hypothetical protein [Vicinamibacteria bacterium]
MASGRKPWIIGGLLLLGGGCGLGLALVLALAFLGGPTVVCVADSNASLTARGPLAFYLGREWRKNPRLVSCGDSEPTHLPTICRRELLGTEISVHDRGFLGITLVGSDLCEQLQQADGIGDITALRPLPPIASRD